MSEPWWTWHWDTKELKDIQLPMKTIKRWRRGSLLTVYRFETEQGDIEYWFYGPFNLAIGFGRGAS